MKKIIVLILILAANNNCSFEEPQTSTILICQIEPLKQADKLSLYDDMQRLTNELTLVESKINGLKCDKLMLENKLEKYKKKNLKKIRLGANIAILLETIAIIIYLDNKN